MKSFLLVLAMSMVLFAFGDAETVTNVRGVQRENSKLVDIYYDLNATDYGTYTIGVEIEGRTIAVTATTFTGDVGEGVTPGTNRHVIWDAGTDWPNKKGDVKAIVTATKEDPTVSHGKVQLWEGGPYWADRNIGADKPWDYGLYFWWGDTLGHRPQSGGGFSFYFAYDRTPTYGKSIATLQSEGWITADGALAPTHDAAHVQWGGGWRMPTRQEQNDLCDKCDWTWTSMGTGTPGYVVRGRGDYAHASIFLPCAGYGNGYRHNNVGEDGYYWSSVPSLNNEWGNSWKLQLYAGYRYGTHFRTESSNRYCGLTIRPVQGFTN